MFVQVQKSLSTFTLDKLSNGRKGMQKYYLIWPQMIPPWASRGLPVGSRMLSLNGSTKKQEPTLFKDTYTWHAGQASKNLENLGLAAAHTLGRRRYLDWSKVLSNNKETIMSRLRAEHYIANLINCLNNQRLSIPSAGNASNTH